MGKTRKDAQQQAAANALRSLAGYVPFCFFYLMSCCVQLTYIQYSTVYVKEFFLLLVFLLIGESIALGAITVLHMILQINISLMWNLTMEWWIKILISFHWKMKMDFYGTLSIWKIKSQLRAHWWKQMAPRWDSDHTAHHCKHR